MESDTPLEGNLNCLVAKLGPKKPRESKYIVFREGAPGRMARYQGRDC